MHLQAKKIEERAREISSLSEIEFAKLTSNARAFSLILPAAGLTMADDCSSTCTVFSSESVSSIASRLQCDSGLEGSDGQSESAGPCHVQSLPADMSSDKTLCDSCSRLSIVHCCQNGYENHDAISPINGACVTNSPRSSSPTDLIIVCTEPQYVDESCNFKTVELDLSLEKECVSAKFGSKQVYFNGIISCYDDADIEKHSSDDDDASSNDTDVDFIQIDDNPDDIIGLSDSSHSHDSLPSSVVIEMPDMDDEEDGVSAAAGDAAGNSGAAKTGGGGQSHLHFASNGQYGGRRAYDYVAGKVQARLNNDAYMAQYWDKMNAARRDCPSLEQYWNSANRGQLIIIIIIFVVIVIW